MCAEPIAADVEPWLRGAIADVHSLLMPTLHSFAQVREDLARWTGGMTDAQVWLRPQGLAPVDRLTTYLEGRQLTPDQLEAARREMDPGAGVSELLDEITQALERSERVIRALNSEILHAPEILQEARYVGRKKLPTTVMGLVVHLAEHTQRHAGALIITAKLVTTR
jgi:hypothetical protein